MFGAWGDAVSDDLSLLQLRALDWDMDGPFRNFPQLTVYHGMILEDEQIISREFINIGYTGTCVCVNTYI
jgi:isopenicillin-N N-acyltransferase-like protein